MSTSRIDQLRAIARTRPLTKTEQIELSNLISDDLDLDEIPTDTVTTSVDPSTGDAKDA